MQNNDLKKDINHACKANYSLKELVENKEVLLEDLKNELNEAMNIINQLQCENKILKQEIENLEYKVSNKTSEVIYDDINIKKNIIEKLNKQIELLESNIVMDRSSYSKREEALIDEVLY